ncbi:MAG: hypothetical protein GX491_18590 [Chloroflexi bacterium]|nr:hypothetical protein [Chloroflexota bacterium]
MNPIIANLLAREKLLEYEREAELARKRYSYPDDLYYEPPREEQPKVSLLNYLRRLLQVFNPRTKQEQPCG